MAKKTVDDELDKKSKEEIKKEFINNIKKELNGDFKKNLKEDIIKEIRYEANTVVKNDIKEQLIIDVNNEIKDNIRKQQRKMLRQKNFKIFKKNIFILLLIAVIIYFGYCLWDARYFAFMKNEEKNASVKEVADESKEKEEKIIKDKTWYIENYGYLLDNTKLSLLSDNYNIYYLYSDNYNVSSIKDTIKLNMAYKFVENISESDYSYTIKEEDMKNAYYKMFGTYDYYNPTSFNVDCMQFYYNSYEKIYVAYKITCESTVSLHIKEEIKDMYEEDGKIIIETVMGVYNENNNYLFAYYNLYNSVASDFDQSKSVLDYEDVLNSYKYVFNKNEQDCYFESIEKVK